MILNVCSLNLYQVKIDKEYLTLLSLILWQIILCYIWFTGKPIPSVRSFDASSANKNR